MRKRTKISLSHYKIGSCKMGYLVPIQLTEVLPGDTIQCSTSLFARVAPLVSPVMHPVHLKIHHWYVPYRLVWDKFEDFITGGPDGLDTSEFPTITAPEAGFAVGSLADYLGIPTSFGGIEISALPFRAYNLIYNEWYRDQDLETELALSTDSGPDTTTATTLQRGDWARDYFTTARPWPQKGLEVTVPVETGAGTFDIVSNGQLNFETTAGYGPLPFKTYDGNGVLAVGPADVGVPNANTALKYKSGLKLGADSQGLGDININTLREAFALQRFEEHRAMYGSRYVEYLRYLGIKASDARLQRPEYLGGGKQTIQFSEVLQTAEGTNPVGTLRGHGIAAARSNRFRRFIEEHGCIISLLLIRPISVYMQGIPRLWLNRVKEDFWQKELEHIGQQEVYTQELYAGAEEGTVFGYQNRYDQYRQHENSVSGEMRTILNYWHMARDFESAPTLNADFINAMPTTRVFASTDTDQIYFMAAHSVQARRLMARYGNPI